MVLKCGCFKTQTSLGQLPLLLYPIQPMPLTVHCTKVLIIANPKLQKQPPKKLASEREIPFVAKS